MKPILYAPTVTAFSNNGVGVLSDAVSCLVTEERNGAFELELQYPITGIHYSSIVMRSLIKSKVDNIRDPQVFRVYSISKPFDGIVTVNAAHLSYDLSGIPVSPFSSASAADAMLKLGQYAVTSCPFTFYTDKTTVANMNLQYPCSIRSQLGGKAGSILDVYGGEYEFDNYTVKLLNSRGADKGVVIRYGKNLVNLKQEQNCASVYTGVYPFWLGQDGTLVQMDNKIINVPGTFNFTRVMMLDLSSEFSEAPTKQQLESKANSYIEANNIGVPKVNLDVEFAQLEQTEEYKNKALLERVQLCDTVQVRFPALGVDATAKCIKTVYNALLDRMEKVELGNARTNLADKIVEQDAAIQDMPSTSVLASMVDQLTESILGAHGGAVRLLDTDDDGTPDTLYIADNPDPALAVKVWRFNYQGWGASNNGYNGPFVLGASIETGLIADFITAGTLNANLIAADTISLGKLKTGTVFTTLNDSGIEIKHSSAGNSSTKLDANGLRIFNASNSLIGGVYVPTGQSAVQAGFTSLFNPSYPNFSIQLIRAYDGESMMYYHGFGLYRQSTMVCGIGVEDSDSPGSGFLFYRGASGVITAVALSTLVSVARAFAGWDPSDFEPASS